VQLELEPAQIAAVYRQGLAKGAEVRRRNTEEWRPLLTATELRPALLSARQLGTGLALATLGLPRRTAPRALLESPPPPPPIQVTERPPPLVRTDSIPDWEDTPLLPLRVASPLAPKAPAPTGTTFGPVSSEIIVTRATRHARLAELASVMALTMSCTLLGSSLWHRPSSAELPKPLAAASALPAAAPAPAGTPLHSGIPVVAVSDLPLEHAVTDLHGLPTSAAAHTPVSHGSSGSAGPDRSALVRALSSAARAASGCGEGPVSTQVVVTFAPSGVARAVHFASGAPQVGLRSCVLNAVARAHIPPFTGDAVTVSKTLRW